MGIKYKSIKDALGKYNSKLNQQEENESKV